MPDNEAPEVDEEYIDMLDDLQRFSIDSNKCYFGPSSNIVFMCKMMDATSSASDGSDNERKLFIQPVRLSEFIKDIFIDGGVVGDKYTTTTAASYLPSGRLITNSYRPILYQAVRLPTYPPSTSI